jgi:hypothetical protein
MRKFVIVMAAAASFGLMATSGASAAPVGATAIDAAADAVSAVQDVRGGWHCPPARCWKWKCVKVWKPRPKPRRCCY